jgi:thioredoxin 1
MVKEVDSKTDIPMDGKVVLDFFATWCGPCKRIAPFFEELSTKYETITFLKVDVDEAGELVDMFGISAMPTFVFLDKGVVVGRVEGADLRAIGNHLESLSGL